MSLALDVSQTIVHLKMEEHGTTTNLPRHGHPPKLTGKMKRAFVREAAKSPMMSLWISFRDSQLTWENQSRGQMFFKRSKSPPFPLEKWHNGNQ